MDLKLHFMKKTLNEVVSMFAAAALSRFATQTKMQDSATQYAIRIPYINRSLESQCSTQMSKKLQYED